MTTFRPHPPAPPVDPAQIYRRAVEALNRGDWPQALALAEQTLPMAPEHAGVHFVAGLAALHQQLIVQALHHLGRAVENHPARADYRAHWALALATAQRTSEAIKAADASAAQDPQDALTLETLGVVYSQANAHTQASRMFGRVAVLQPQSAGARFNLATSLTFLGQLDQAGQEYEACISLNPRFWKAHLALAKLRRQRADDNHVQRLVALIAEHPDDTDGQMHLHLALSKEYEDLGDYPGSFAHLAAGKAAGRGSRGSSSARDDALFDALEQTFAATPPPGEGFPSQEPIFVIGMPRSGTTLVDRILSSHSQVHSAGELQNFGALLKQASGSATPHLLDPDTIARSQALDWAELGRAYVDSTRPGTGRTPHFIDKLPHNFLRVGHIAQALPGARIICLRRNAMDTCLSNFRQLFAQSSSIYDYSFDLLDTGRYYLRFDRLMKHWQRILPGRVLEIDYESLVDDQAARTRELLAFCGLPWEEACLRFELNDAPVSTASATQVRQPMYRTALQRWKRYAPQLQGLRELLEDGGVVVD